MKVIRRMKIEPETYEVGDVIKFKLIDGEKVRAMAVKETLRGMLFVLVDCLTKEYPMFEDIDSMDYDGISYMTSDLRKNLNGEILARFPKKIRSRMAAVDSEGDMLRIPTEREIFGDNVYGQEESKVMKRWEPMKKRRKRIALRGKEGAFEQYWLMNCNEDCAYYFAGVDCYGNMGCYNFRYPLGIRPVFLLER